MTDTCPGALPGVICRLFFDPQLGKFHRCNPTLFFGKILRPSDPYSYVLVISTVGRNRVASPGGTYDPERFQMISPTLGLGCETVAPGERRNINETALSVMDIQDSLANPDPPVRARPAVSMEALSKLPL